MTFLRSALGALAVSALLTGVAQAEPVKIRMAYVVPVSNWAPMIADKLDLAKHHGKSYTFEAIRYQGTPPMITALAGGELEIGTLAFSTLPFAVQNAGLTDLKVIGDEFQDGIGDNLSNEFFVLKDGPIKKLTDLKGKVVATNAQGSGIDIGMKLMLRKAGLEANRDYTVVEAPFPAMAAMLLDKKVDMIAVPPPFSFAPQLLEAAKVIGHQADGTGPSQFAMWVARGSFIEKNRAAMQDFMEDALRIVRWYLDPKNHDEVAKIASKQTKAPPERFGWVFTKKDYYRDPNLVPNLKNLQANIQSVKEMGLISEVIDVKKHADLSLVEEAAKRLK